MKKTTELTMLTCFYILSLSLLQLEAKCVNASNPMSVHELYDKSLATLTSILWGNDSNPEQDVLLSPIVSARDVTSLLSLVSSNSIDILQNYVTVYHGFSTDLRKVVNRTAELTNGDFDVSTTPYSRQWNLITHISESINPEYSKESVNQLSEHKEMEEDQSYAIFTEISWNISAIQLSGANWIEPMRFFRHTSNISLKVRAIHTVGHYDYAEFELPKASNCTLKVLRLNYTSELTLNFILPLNHNSDDCMSEQGLWTSMKDVDLRLLNYSSQQVFVSIPIFKATASVDLKKRLDATPLGETLTLEAKKFHDAILKQDILFNFAPEIPDGPIPSISRDTMGFFVDRPFYFAIGHGTSQTPLLAGLITLP